MTDTDTNDERAPWAGEDGGAPGQDGSAGGTDPHEMVDLCVEMWNSAREHERLSERLASADTTVDFHFTDGGDECGLSLMLDESPIEARSGLSGDAEIHIYGPSSLFLDMVRQDRQMAMLITSGELTYTGPVRKFLRVVPVMRRLNFDMFSHSHDQAPQE